MKATDDGNEQRKRRRQAGGGEADLVVFALGSRVLVGDDAPLEGTVTGVTIRGWSVSPAVQYEVAWWDGNTRRAEWLHDYEVAAGRSSHRVRIGFTG